jgi:hypothetical protein
MENKEVFTMKKWIRMLMLTTVLISFGSLPMGHAEELIIQGFELVAKGSKVRVWTTEWTKSLEVKKEASFSFSKTGVNAIVDGNPVGEFVMPKKLPDLKEGTIIDGVVSSLTFYRKEKAMITFDNGISWTNMGAKAAFFTKDDKVYVKFLRRRFGRKSNLGVRTFEIQE